MESDCKTQIVELLRRSVGSVFPGAVVLINAGGETVVHQAFGRLGPAETDPEVTCDTIFDVASLTKVMATGPAVLMLHERGLLSIDRPLSTYVPQFDGPLKSEVTLRHLLAHSAGLRGWAPLYLFANDSAGILRLLHEVPLMHAPGETVEYSCLGFILLGKLVEQSTGETLGSFATKEIFEPLGMMSTQFNPASDLRDRIAPTEDRNLFERELASSFLAEIRDAGSAEAEFWLRRSKAEEERFRAFISEPTADEELDVSRWPFRRDYLIRGEVHDTNAYRLRGVSGNAGIFSTASDVAKFAEAFLAALKGRSGTTLLSRATAREMVKRQGPLEGKQRGLGWKLVACENDGPATAMSEGSFGHDGFTGCSLWIDPERELIVVLLSNAICPRYRPEAIGSLRRGLHNLAVEMVDSHH